MKAADDKTVADLRGEVMYAESFLEDAMRADLNVSKASERLAIAKRALAAAEKPNA